MTLRTRILACCCVLLATAACRKDETVAAYGGSDRIWQLTEIDGEAFAAEATLTFPETGKIAGTAPCNSYSAAMTVPYPWFGAGPIAATRRACPALEAETIFFKALGEMTLSEVLGDTLVLSTPEGRSMIFISGG